MPEGPSRPLEAAELMVGLGALAMLFAAAPIVQWTVDGVFRLLG